MPTRLRRPAAVFVLLSAVLWLSLAGAAPAQAEKGYRRDVYFAAGYEHQVNSVTCTAASTAMMVNFIARRDLNLNQSTILSWEKPRDALRDSIQRGSDPLGWSRAATYYASKIGHPTTYTWEAYGSARSALRRAAIQIARTGKPVGLLVSHGTHAMVMTGVQASIDPTRSSTFTLFSIMVSDPNGLPHQAYPATASPLNSYLQTDATPSYDAAWYGRYIVIVPEN